MDIWIWLMLATSPIAFLISFHYTYRWAFFDSGGGSKLYWKMLRRDLHCSIPGKHGDIARITHCRGWIRKYAKMGNSVHFRGINEPFKTIWKHKKYEEYQDFFMPPKWWIWRKMAFCLVWPISFLIWSLLNITMMVWYFFVEL